MIISWLTLCLLTCVVGSQNTIPLRIMPLGASSTFGVGSSTGDGYRKNLRDTLVQAGHRVNMVGRNKNGNFTDNDVEAVGGNVIAQIAESARASVPHFLPNLVLLDAGANNCNDGRRTAPDAAAQVAAMVDDIFRLSPGVTVVLAQILPNTIADQDACRVDINRQYREVVAPRYQGSTGSSRAKFVLVDMRDPNGGIIKADLFDTRHPNDAGYVKMANVWYRGIKVALDKGYITRPADNGVPLDG